MLGTAPDQKLPETQRAKAVVQDPSDHAEGMRDTPQHSTVLEGLRGRWSVDDALLLTDLPLAPVTICNGALGRGCMACACPNL